MALYSYGTELGDRQRQQCQPLALPLGLGPAAVHIFFMDILLGLNTAGMASVAGILIITKMSRQRSDPCQR